MTEKAHPSQTEALNYIAQIEDHQDRFVYKGRYYDVAQAIARHEAYVSAIGATAEQKEAVDFAIGYLHVHIGTLEKERPAVAESIRGIVRTLETLAAAPAASPQPNADYLADSNYRAAFLSGWQACLRGDEKALDAATKRVGSREEYAPAASEQQEVVAPYWLPTERHGDCSEKCELHDYGKHCIGDRCTLLLAGHLFKPKADAGAHCSPVAWMITDAAGEVSFHHSDPDVCNSQRVSQPLYTAPQRNTVTEPCGMTAEGYCPRQIAPRTEEMRTGLFMDGVDFDDELGHASGGNRVYPSVDDLKKNSKCWQGCGIVEVEVRLVRWVEEQNLGRDMNGVRK